MKKILILFLSCFAVTIFFSLIIKEKNNYDNQTSNILLINNYSDNLLSKITKRNYNYLYYSNSDNYIVKNKNDIRNSIYNGLNNGKDVITLYCDYDDYNDCLNDFHLIYDDKYLMSSISNYVSPYNSYSSIRYMININNNLAKIELFLTKKYSNEQIVEIEKIIDVYMRESNISKMNDIEKVKWAHDLIISKNEYDYSALTKDLNDAYSAYGAIVNNRSMCQGYAESMAILLDRFNIPNIMISNDNHIWNLVMINDQWLHLDTTWDDSLKSNKKYNYYLISNEELTSLDSSGNHEYNHDYYLETLH